MHGRDKATLASVGKDLHSAAVPTVQVTADVTRLPEIEAMRQEIDRRLGPIDIGRSYSRPGPLEGISQEEWQPSIDGNLTATFLTIKSVLLFLASDESAWITGTILDISGGAVMA